MCGEVREGAKQRRVMLIVASRRPPVRYVPLAPASAGPERVARYGLHLDERCLLGTANSYFPH